MLTEDNPGCVVRLRSCRVRAWQHEVALPVDRVPARLLVKCEAPHLFFDTAGWREIRSRNSPQRSRTDRSQPASPGLQPMRSTGRRAIAGPAFPRRDGASAGVGSLPPGGPRASSARDAEDRSHLARRHARAVGRGAGPRPHAHAALRPRRVRGHPLLRAPRRALGDLPPARAHRSTVRLGARPRPARCRGRASRSWRRASRPCAPTGSRECYLRPIVFLGDGEMGLSARPPTRVAIAAWPWGAYLGDEGMRNGIRVKTSSFQRFHPEHADDQGEGGRPLRQLDPRGARGAHRGLRRGAPARRRRLRVGGERREHLHRASRAW